MKKAVLLTTALLVILGCNSGSVTGPTPEQTTTPTTTVSSTPQIEQVFEFKYVGGEPNLLLRYRVAETKKLHVVTGYIADQDEIGPTEDVMERRYHQRCYTGEATHPSADLLKRSTTGNWVTEKHIEVTVPICGQGPSDPTPTPTPTPTPNPNPSPNPNPDSLSYKPEVLSSAAKVTKSLGDYHFISWKVDVGSSANWRSIYVYAKWYDADGFELAYDIMHIKDFKAGVHAYTEETMISKSLWSKVARWKAYVNSAYDLQGMLVIVRE